MNEKVCSKCHEPKPQEEFYRGTRVGKCKACKKAIEAQRHRDRKAADEAAHPDQNHCRPLDPIDEIPCPRCHLRGHEAGDPDRCLFGDATAGLGGSMALAARAVESHGGLRIKLEGMDQGRRVGR